MLQERMNIHTVCRNTVVCPESVLFVTQWRPSSIGLQLLAAQALPSHQYASIIGTLSIKRSSPFLWRILPRSYYLLIEIFLGLLGVTAATAVSMEKKKKNECLYSLCDGLKRQSPFKGPLHETYTNHWRLVSVADFVQAKKSSMIYIVLSLLLYQKQTIRIRYTHTHNPKPHCSQTK